MKTMERRQKQAVKNGRMVRGVTLTMVISLVCMTVYQLLKRLLFPRMTLLESNITTVLFISVVATIIAYVCLHKYCLLYQQTLEEIAKQKRVEEALRHRDAILEGTASAIEHFLATADWKQSINRALACLGKATKAGRAYVFENHTNAAGVLLTSQRYEWVAEGVVPQIDNPSLRECIWYAGDMARWAFEMQNRNVICGHVRELPEGEQKILAPQGIKSILVVPIFVGTEWWGLIGFDECRKEREWSPPEVEALKVGAGILGAVIQRGMAQEELHLFKSIVESSKEAIGICNHEGQVIYVNPALQTLFACSSEEARSRNMRDFFPPDSVELIDRKIFPALKEGHGWDGELDALRGNGDRFPLWQRVDSLHDDKGNMLFGFGLMHDVTEKRRMQEALLESERRFRQVLENLVEDRTFELAAANEQLNREIEERRRIEEALREGQEQLKGMSARLSEIEEAEKKRLSMELHDRVGQNLSALSINLNIIKGLLPDELASRVKDLINDSSQLVKETGRCIRNVMADLRPPVLDAYGLEAALRWYVEEYSQRTGMNVNLMVEDMKARLPLSMETTLFRIAQEALTNVARHAQATHVTITLDRIAGELQLTIADNGVGFDPEAVYHPGKPAGWGLFNMRERAEGIKGKLYVESAPGKGTRVHIKVAG